MVAHGSLSNHTNKFLEVSHRLSLPPGFCPPGLNPSHLRCLTLPLRILGRFQGGQTFRQSLKLVFGFRREGIKTAKNAEHERARNPRRSVSSRDCTHFCGSLSCPTARTCGWRITWLSALLLRRRAKERRPPSTFGGTPIRPTRRVAASGQKDGRHKEQAGGARMRKPLCGWTKRRGGTNQTSTAHHHCIIKG